MSHSESHSSKTDRLVARTQRHVERHLERGETVFAARPLLASLAIGLMTGERYTEAYQATAQAAIATLEAHGAQGEVFAVRQDLGNGQEDSRDKVIVTHRNGLTTDAHYGTERVPGVKIVSRARTESTE